VFSLEAVSIFFSGAALLFKGGVYFLPHPFLATSRQTVFMRFYVDFSAF
jgi:hypothetical protein